MSGTKVSRGQCGNRPPIPANCAAEREEVEWRDVEAAYDAAIARELAPLPSQIEAAVNDARTHSSPAAAARSEMATYQALRPALARDVSAANAAAAKARKAAEDNDTASSRALTELQHVMSSLDVTKHGPVRALLAKQAELNLEKSRKATAIKRFLDTGNVAYGLEELPADVQAPYPRFVQAWEDASSIGQLARMLPAVGVEEEFRGQGDLKIKIKVISKDAGSAVLEVDAGTALKSNRITCLRKPVNGPFGIHCIKPEPEIFRHNQKCLLVLTSASWAGECLLPSKLMARSYAGGEGSLARGRSASELRRPLPRHRHRQHSRLHAAQRLLHRNKCPRRVSVSRKNALSPLQNSEGRPPWH